MLGFQLRALWEVVETLGDEAWLEEVGVSVGSWGFQATSCSCYAVCFLTIYEVSSSLLNIPTTMRFCSSSWDQVPMH